MGLFDASSQYFAAAHRVHRGFIAEMLPEGNPAVGMGTLSVHKRVCTAVKAVVPEEAGKIRQRSFIVPFRLF